jgi:pimeloyl-ACP methyl ester carboxylesterase
VGYRVLLPDLIGYGYSSKPTGIDYSLDLFSTTWEVIERAACFNRCVLDFLAC